jgi:hypothetical protein
MKPDFLVAATSLQTKVPFPFSLSHHEIQAVVHSSFPGLSFWDLYAILKFVHQGPSSKKKEELIRQSYAIIKSVREGT